MTDTSTVEHARELVESDQIDRDFADEKLRLLRQKLRLLRQAFDRRASPSASPDALVQRLRELLAKATPGPWGYDVRPGTACHVWVPSQRLTTVDGDLAYMDTREDIADLRKNRREEDAALMVEAVNALPTLLAALSTRPVDEVREALEKAIATLAASRHIIAKYVPEHHWLPEHDQRISDLRQALSGRSI